LFYKLSAKIESFLGIKVNIGDFLLQISFFIVFFAFIQTYTIENESMKNELEKW